MKIDTTLIKGYDSLSLEEKVALLESLDFEMNGYVDKKTFDKTASELADYKKKWKSTLDDNEKARMENNEALELIRNELAEVKAEKDKLIADKQLADIKAGFLSNGFNEELALDSAKAYMSGDMNRVFRNQKAFIDEREAKIKADLLKSTPTPPNGGSPKAITKEEFDNMSYHERAKLFEEDKELYNELNGGN